MSSKPVPRRGGLVVLSIVLALALLVVVGGGMFRLPSRTPAAVQTSADGTPGPDRQARAVDAYTELVRNEFIDKQRLVVRRDVDDNAGVPIVDLAPKIYHGEDPEAWSFAAGSFLLNDIRRNDPSIWTIENGRVIDIDSSLHLTPGPFESRGGWRGRVLYRSPPVSPAAADDIAFAPYDSRAPRLYLVGEADRMQTGDPRLQIVSLDRFGQPDTRGPAVRVYCRFPDAPVATLKRVGDQAIVVADAPTKDCAVRVAGRTLRKKEFAAVGPGDHVAFQAGAERVVEYQRVSAAAPVDELSLPSATGGRVRAPSAAWWSLAVEKDFAKPLSRVSGRSQDITTSLDPVLQPGAQALLDQYVAASRPTAKDKTLRIGAITVMDAQTGEVLAMASTPHASLSRVTLVDEDDVNAKAARLNQNLQLLPIGSSAKPLFSAAILSVHPDLIGLTIPTQEETENLLGMPINKLQTHTVGKQVDFDSFIQWSDNIYAASLLLMGSRDRGPRTCPLKAGQWYSLGGAAIRDKRPKSIFEQVAPDGSCRAAEPVGVNQLDWAGRLHDLFDANILARGEQGQTYVANCSAGGGRYGDDIHDATPWRRLFAETPDRTPCHAINSTPTREALALDAARNFRSDLLPTMLGNGEGLWSPVKLAEAYSRLVTGRRVDASFTPLARAEGRPLTDYPADIRRRLTHAMTLVMQGTAANTELPGALTAAAGEVASVHLVLGAFAKTGTPVLAKADYSDVDKTINLLIRRGLVLYREGQVRVSVGSESMPLGGGMSSAEINRMARDLGAQPAFHEAIDQFGVSPRAVIRTLAEYVRQMKEGRTPFVVERGELLVRVGSRRDDNGDDSDDQLPHGKVLALVVAAYDPGKSPDLTLGRDGRADNAMAQAACAYTVVVNLQFQVPGRSNAAADLAGRVVKQLLAKRLACGERSGPHV